MRIKFENHPSEAEIISHWDKRLRNPMVSICCASYNQAEFMDATFHGFLIQETRFPFEILCRDDGSSDGTADIIRKFQKRYPNIVKAKIEKTNKFTLGEKPAEYFFAFSRAKYIAWCDGDDHWIDPHKLQKQIAFLEKNEDFVMVGHDCVNYNRNEDSFIEPEFHKQDGSRMSLILGHVYAPTLTRVHRNKIRELPVEFKRVVYGDLFINSMLGRYGKYKYLNDILPSVRNVHDNGVASGASAKTRAEDHIILFFWLYRYYKRLGKTRISAKFFSKFVLWSKKRVGVSANFDQALTEKEFLVLKQKIGIKRAMHLIDGRSLIVYGIPELIKKLARRFAFFK